MTYLSALTTLKDELGWFYFIAWSSTFYPQVLLNMRRKQTAGLSHDFALMGWVGFVAYAAFTIFGFAIPSVKEAFVRERGAPPPIEVADVLFASHALVIVTLWIAQIVALPPGANFRRGVFLSCMAAFACVVAVVVAALWGTISWVFSLNVLGFIKVSSSILKHFPQIMLSFKRKRTVGFSITMILLDLVGSLGSFAQQGVRCIIDKSWEPFIGNPSKLFLALESFCFDLFFTFQHFVLYKENNDFEQGIPYESSRDEESHRRL